MTSRSDRLAELRTLPALTLTPKGVLAGACATYDEGLPAAVLAAFHAWFDDMNDRTWAALLRALLDTREDLPEPVAVALGRYCRTAWSAAQLIAAEVEGEDVTQS